MPDRSGRKSRAFESLLVGAFGSRLWKCTGDVGDVAAVTAEALFLDGDAEIYRNHNGDMMCGEKRATHGLEKDLNRSCIDTQMLQNKTNLCIR